MKERLYTDYDEELDDQDYDEEYDEELDDQDYGEEEEYEEENDEDDGIAEYELGNTGLITWVDKEDEELFRYTWQAKKAGSKEFPHYYAFRPVGGVIKSEYYLHNEDDFFL